jgi:hypothetical protein
VSVSQGFNYAVGLRGNGEVLYIGFDKENTATINQRLEIWTDISLITTFDNFICGVQNDGTYFSVDLE